MTVRSFAAFDGIYTQVAAAYETLYTVPADRTLIVKDVRGVIASAGSFSWYLRSSGGGIIAAREGAATAFFAASPEPWAVLTEGRSLQVFGPAGAVYQLIVSGSLLLGDPA